MRPNASALSFPSYYRANEVQQFRYSRPFRKGEKDPENEFAVSPLGLSSLCVRVGWDGCGDSTLRIWRPEDNIGCPSSGESYGYFDSGTLLGTVADQPGLAGVNPWRSSSISPPKHCKACAPTPGFVPEC